MNDAQIHDFRCLLQNIADSQKKILALLERSEKQTPPELRSDNLFLEGVTGSVFTVNWRVAGTDDYGEIAAPERDSFTAVLRNPDGQRVNLGARIRTELKNAVLEFNSGRLRGTYRTVEYVSQDGRIKLNEQLPFRPERGDLFTVYQLPLSGFSIVEGAEGQLGLGIVDLAPWGFDPDSGVWLHRIHDRRDGVVNVTDGPKDISGGITAEIPSFLHWTLFLKANNEVEVTVQFAPVLGAPWYEAEKISVGGTHGDKIKTFDFRAGAVRLIANSGSLVTAQISGVY